MPKWVYPLAFAFVIFLIFNDASGAGDMAGRFAGFIVDLLGAIGEFLTGLFEGAGGNTGNTANTTPPTPENQPSFGGGGGAAVEQFTHTHDGVTHTHTVTSDHTVSGN